MIIRLRIFGFVFLFLMVGLVARLFFWQIIEASELGRQGQLQYQRSSSELARRGSIIASDGNFWTTDEAGWTLFATKATLTENVRAIANKLATLLVEDTKDQAALLAEAQRIEGLLSGEAAWIPVAHRVNADVKKNIEALGIVGIGFDPEPTRNYPEGSASAHLLGFVGKDDDGNSKGYFGLEGYYDLTLAGKPGFLKRESDANGVPILFGNSREIDPLQGIDLATSIDKTVQFTIEKELKEGIERYGAKNGTIIVMDPRTGFILGMASSPSYDPREYWEYTDDGFRDPAISNTFEPGSIFKPIIMASALDADLIKPETVCDICDKPVVVDNYEIDTWNHEYYPDSTMREVITHSDNIGMVFVGRKLGKGNLYDYLKKFGFGESTGIDLQGEVNVALRAKGTWSDIDVATTTFGQGIAVTPIQILRGIAILANDGIMVRPQVVREIRNGTWTSEVKPQVGPRVISKEAAEEIQDMMVSVVREGESKWAAPSGFSIAGKTGTAQIPVAGHYDPTKTIASFVGFAPAHEPKFVMLVTFQEPTSSIYGAETAAPVWFNIARDLFPYFGIQPEN